MLVRGERLCYGAQVGSRVAGRSGRWGAASPVGSDWRSETEGTARPGEAAGAIDRRCQANSADTDRQRRAARWGVIQPAEGVSGSECLALTRDSRDLFSFL